MAAPAVLLLTGCMASGRLSAEDDDRSYTTWSSYLGTPDSAQYSALKHINKSNVQQLEVAWTYPTGEATIHRFGPLVVDRVMYVLSGSRALVALDAATGQELWTRHHEGRVGDRGISYWESADRSDRRLLYINEGLLTAIDARTGNTIASFGNNGQVDLKVGLHRDLTNMRPLQTGNPGRVFENLIITSLPAEGGLRYRSNPGDVRAYDVRTGELKWTFHSVPESGEFGADTWPDSALADGSGVHNWSESTLDERRGIIYVPFGTARFDFYGGNRHGANLFANSLVALDARTGKRLWHFQTIHHDVWDYDLKVETSMSWRSRPSTGSSSCSTACRARRCGRLKSGRCRRPTCPVSRRRRRSPSRRRRRLSHGSHSPRRTSIRTYRKPSRRSCAIDYGTPGTKGCSHRRVLAARS
jgi:quinoprotein glucose dehydrogenase